MSNKKKIKVTLALINVLLTAVEFYLQWQLSKSENELQLSKQVGLKQKRFSPIFFYNMFIIRLIMAQTCRIK